MPAPFPAARTAGFRTSTLDPLRRAMLIILYGDSCRRQDFTPMALSRCVTAVSSVRD
jgi:hypothetical protein